VKLRMTNTEQRTAVRRSSFVVPCSLFCVSLVLAGCGGEESSSPTPTSPAPIPAADTCTALGSTPSSGLSILNGSACSADRSSVVLLNMRTSDGLSAGSCSGTVLTPRTILTAAHCLDEQTGIVRVWLGSGAEIVAQSFTFYPNYQFNVPGSFDVGVVVMAADLPRNGVPVLTSRDARAGETAIIAGWGRDQNDVSATLRAGSTSLTSVTSSLLQTQYAPPASSVCSGDSGGPILVNEAGAWVIAGITSATSNNICNTGTNFFQSTRNQSVRDFILQHGGNVAQR
jgi:hypothetical protein